MGDIAISAHVHADASDFTGMGGEEDAKTKKIDMRIKSEIHKATVGYLEWARPGMSSPEEADDSAQQMEIVLRSFGTIPSTRCHALILAWSLRLVDISTSYPRTFALHWTLPAETSATEESESDRETAEEVEGTEDVEGTEEEDAPDDEDATEDKYATEREDTADEGEVDGGHHIDLSEFLPDSSPSFNLLQSAFAKCL